MAEDILHRQNIIACIWDFDKTLIPGYMQVPIFRRYGVDAKTFWEEVAELPRVYADRGQRVSEETVYLNHLLSYIRWGEMKGLNNQILEELGSELQFHEGLPDFFADLKNAVAERPDFRKHGITLEHYVVSTGLASMIRGSAIAPHVENIWGCELIENPVPPHYRTQPEFDIGGDREITQIGTIVDNTIKTRFIFEINKGTNKNPDIDVNAKVGHGDRRVPIQNMIYIADGPSDIPVFSVVKHGGGKTFAVYTPDSAEEFAQNDNLQQLGRVHAYGPANYAPGSSSHVWIKMHVVQIGERIVREREHAVAMRVSRPPRHIHPKPPEAEDDGPQQATFLEDQQE